MRRRSNDMNERINKLLLSRPIASTAFAIVVLWFMINAASLASLDESALDDPLAWIALGTLVNVPVLVLFLPRLTKRRAYEILLLRWAFSGTATLIPFVALFEGAPRWLLGVGFVESVVLLIFSMRAAKRTSPPSDDQSN